MCATVTSYQHTRKTDVESYFLNLNLSFTDNQSDHRYLKGNSNFAGLYMYLSLCADYCTLFFQNKVPWGTPEGTLLRCSSDYMQLPLEPRNLER